LDAGLDRVVETEVGIGEEHHANNVHSLVSLQLVC
jgi:hypothetical protein